MDCNPSSEAGGKAIGAHEFSLGDGVAARHLPELGLVADLREIGAIDESDLRMGGDVS